MQGWEWTIHNSTVKRFAWSVNWIFMFMSLKTDSVQLWFLNKSDLRTSTAEENIRIFRIKRFEFLKNDNIFHIIDKI